MKSRIGIVLLGLACVVLAIVAIVVRKQAVEQHDQDSSRMASLSNQVVKVNDKLEEQKQVATTLEKDLKDERDHSLELTNKITQVSGDLSKSEEALHASQAEVKKDETKIAELESKNQELDKQAVDLSTSITNLNVQIADTQKKLAASEGDKAFLESQLNRLIAEKKELERQFNDLTVLRAQVAKLKEELNVARRIEWIRQGLFARLDQKGAQQLMTGIRTPTPAATTPKPMYDLNVELGADGSVKVVPPGTNAPAKK